MSDLYASLEELQEMTRVLGADVTRLALALGNRSPQAQPTEAEEGARRAYVRAVFALIEAVVEQHKRLLLDLLRRGAAPLPMGIPEVLSEQTFVVDDAGRTGTRDQFLNLRRKIRTVCGAAGGLGGALVVDTNDPGWAALKEAIKVRDRITHPRTFDECHIDGPDLDAVDSGHAWFRDLNTRFVQLARTHRTQHGW